MGKMNRLRSQGVTKRVRLDKPLNSERLYLDTLVPDRLNPAYVEWLNDNEVNRFLEARFHRHTPESVCQFVSDMNDSADNLLLGVFLKRDRQHIGNIKIGPVVKEHSRADIGLMIGDRSVWGQGYASEAIGAVTAHALDAMGLHRVTAGCYSDNVGSYKAFMKNGYLEDGRLKAYFWLDDGWQDHVVMYKLAE